jgi:hypothetical protein
MTVACIHRHQHTSATTCSSDEAQRHPGRDRGTPAPGIRFAPSGQQGAQVSQYCQPPRVQSRSSRSRGCAAKHPDGYRDTVYRRIG